MARSYKRDARGRFAGGGYSGQTGGRGARLTAKGERKGGGAKMTAGRVGGTIGKPKGLKPQQGVSASRKPGTVPLDQVRRYNNLDRARNRQKKTFDREISRVGSSNRMLANSALPKADLALRKTQRIESTMRRLSNSPNSPNVPTLPRAKKLGEAITGPRNLYKRVTPRTKAAPVPGTIKKPKAKPAPAPKPAPVKPRGVAAASRAYGQKVRNVLGMRMLGAQRGGIRSSAVGKQGNLFGGSDSVKGYKATRSQVRPGRYKSGRIRSGSYSGRS